jgi:hypothetical protein
MVDREMGYGGIQCQPPTRLSCGEIVVVTRDQNRICGRSLEPVSPGVYTSILVARVQTPSVSVLVFGGGEVTEADEERLLVTADTCHGD